MSLSSKIENKVRDTIKKFDMLHTGDKVIVGVSGGPDSMCLLHMLCFMLKDYNLDLYAVHINHLLRAEEAYRDETHTKRICEQWKIPIFIKRIDVLALAKEKGISVEEAGREIRYREFNNVLHLVGADKIAVAHNMDDNAETVLMRLIRGTGIDGLTGIKPTRGNIIRPIIGLQREEICQYCRDNNIDVVIDSSNKQVDVTRNKIRNILLELIKKDINSDVISVIMRTSELIREDAEFLKEFSEEAYIKCLVNKEQPENQFFKDTYGSILLDSAELNKLPIPIKKRVIRRAIKEVKNNLTDIEVKHVEDILELSIKGRTGATIDLPDNLKVSRSYNTLEFFRKDVLTDSKVDFEVRLNIPGTICVPEIGIEVVAEINDLCVDNHTNAESDKKYLHKICLDYDKIQGNVFLRNRKQGDIFKPAGMIGTKKLKKYMIDEKIPRNERDNILLIAVGNEVMCIVGGRMSEKYKKTEKTRKELVIKIYEGRR